MSKNSMVEVYYVGNLSGSLGNCGLSGVYIITSDRTEVKSYLDLAFERGENFAVLMEKQSIKDYVSSNRDNISLAEVLSLEEMFDVCITFDEGWKCGNVTVVDR